MALCFVLFCFVLFLTTVLSKEVGGRVDGRLKATGGWKKTKGMFWGSGRVYSSSEQVFSILQIFIGCLKTPIVTQCTVYT